ncbi:MAG: peptidoglycan bridge formation glycyltransferase FemA/FemB family protein [bacterium]
MRIINIIEKKQLNDFVGGEKRAQFLQSWQWGEFQREVSGIIWRIGVEENGKLIASAKLVKKQLPIGRSYFYCGRGPVIAENAKSETENILNFLFEEIKKIAEAEAVMFLRFEPTFKFELANSRLEENFQIFKTIDVQPSKTLILDLTKSESEILKQMRQKTRYNIHLAEKKGVKIIEAAERDFEEFWRILSTTGDRDEFNLHGRSYYKAMLKMDSDFIKLSFARYGGNTLASSLSVFFGDTAVYIHGGSSNENRETMAPYALQWHNIMLAKKSGFKYYDFHGIDEKKWPGVTRFKIGFGGEIAEYPGTFDLVYDAGWYNIYKMVRKIRRTF